MTWIAPPVERVDEPFTADERTTLEALLEWHRATILRKCSGLTGARLAERSVPPSSMSLLGLLRHLTAVERTWFRRRVAGEPLDPVFPTDRKDIDFDDLDPDRAEADYDAYRQECAAARLAVEGRSLEDTFEHPTYGPMSLRWTYLHMIEEYAGHNGHADLLRERIDGTTDI